MKPNKSFITSFIVGITFMTIGLTLSLTGFTNMGMAFFFFMPLAIGISSGILPDTKQAFYGVLVSLAVFSIFLLFTAIEGIICIIMALPIILIAVGIGWAVGKIIRHIRKDKEESNLKLSFSPIIIIVIANFFEVFSGSTMIPASVSSTVILNASPSEVYNAIIEVDTVNVDLNLLQELGLPIPRKCTLTEEKVGGLRVCDFEEGQIIETITEIQKNKKLRMDVTTTDLGNRNWLRFDEDIYDINPINETQTSITRTTTYFSNLKPRIYWELMESITIKSEQDFVFRNLKKDLNQ